MSELPPSAARYDPRQAPPTDRSLGSRLSWVAILPVVAATVLGAAATIYLALRPKDASPAVIWSVVGVALAGCLAAILIAALQSRALAQRLQQRTGDARGSIARFREELHQLTEQWGRGEPPGPFGIETPATEGDELAELQNDIRAARHAALTALTELPQPKTQPAATVAPEGGANTTTRIDVFVSLSRRLQALLHQEIQLLDEMESQVEDPDFLKGLFSIDHLATRIRRHAENLAVLGGGATRRQWSSPVAVNDILRSAVAEVEQYVRVKLVRPIEGELQGHAVADVVHLVAELVENATRFSAPQTQVLLRTEMVTAGLAVEVEDRGLGIPREEQNQINSMLMAPDVVNFDELLRDGRIGLFVVGALAKRHGIAVQVQTNIFGGTQAVMVLPAELMGDHPAVSAAEATEPAADAAPDVVRLTSNEMVHTQEMEAVSAPSAEAAPPLPPAVEAAPAVPAQHAAVEPARLPWKSSAPRSASEQGPAVPAQPAAFEPVRPEPSPPASSSAFEPQQSAPRSASEQGPAVPAQPAAFEPVRPQSSPPSPSPRPRPSPMTANDLPTQAASVGTELSWSSPSPNPRPSPRPTPPQEDRPELPQRRRQAHLAPQLRDAPAEPHSEAGNGHDPGLLGAFKQGMSRADDGLEEAPGRGDES